MHNNTHIQTVATGFSRSREREPSNSGTFVRLNVPNYKRAEQSDQEREVLRQHRVRTSSVFEVCENLTSKSYHSRGGCKLNNEQKSCA